MERYDATKDEQFSKGYIDVDEWRIRKLDDGRELPYRYMHGGFEGTAVKFSYCFPRKEDYGGRFYQYLSPFPGPEEELASLPVTGVDDKIAFCLTHGAYYVESNMAPIAETLELAENGDRVHLDNSDYIAVQTYHRHQDPSADYHAWDQFRDEAGNPKYPQRPRLLGPLFTGHGPGCEQNGRIGCKTIIVAALMDEQAYPWQADWYRRKAASVYEGDETEIERLWYFDNVLHGDVTGSENELYVTTYVAGLKQALIDLAAWVEKGIAPLPSTNYRVDVGHVIVPESAQERGGIQPVPQLTANGARCTRVKAGEAVSFEVKAEVPEGAGALTFVEWSFEGEAHFPEKGAWELFENGRKGVARVSHTYAKPSTYFAVVRVKSERNGDRSQLFTQIRNIGRVLVIVE